MLHISLNMALIRPILFIISFFQKSTRGKKIELVKSSNMVN